MSKQKDEKDLRDGKFIADPTGDEADDAEQSDTPQPENPQPAEGDPQRGGATTQGPK